MADDAVTKAAEEAAARLEAQIAEVWVLEECLPYDGSEILGVYFDPLKAKAALNPNLSWVPTGDNKGWMTYDEDKPSNPYFLIYPHPLTH